MLTDRLNSDSVLSMKTCKRCQGEKDLSCFSKNARNKDKLHSYCRDCATAIAVEWKRKNPEKAAKNVKNWESKNKEHIRKKRSLRETPEQRALYVRRWALKKYGLTFESFSAKLKAQGSRCVICEKGLTEENAVIDHCHATGKTRDLLCRTCNLQLGIVERPNFLKSCISYLESHRSKS